MYIIDLNAWMNHAVNNHISDYFQRWEIRYGGEARMLQTSVTEIFNDTAKFITPHS